MNEKICNTCKNTKPLTNFYPVSDGKYGRAAVCKSCRLLFHKKYNGTPAMLKRNRRRNLYKYGITELDYLTLLFKQNYQCAICKSPNAGGKGAFHVDHCHSTKKVRGLLCHFCNLALGNFKDSTEVLESAIIYLKAVSK